MLKKLLEELKNGYSCRFLSRKYNISEKTISTWQQKLWHPEKYPNQGPKRGKLKESNLTKEVSINKYKNTILSLDSKIIVITKKGNIKSNKEELAI